MTIIDKDDIDTELLELWKRIEFMARCEIAKLQYIPIKENSNETVQADNKG